MARCMLCSTVVADTAVVCPLCGGAVEHAPEDATQVQGIDLTKVDAPPPAEEAWPGEGPFTAPPGPDPGPGPGPGPWGQGPYPGFTYGPPPGPGPGYGYGPPPTPYGAGGYAPSPVPYGTGPAWPGYVPRLPTEGLAIGSFVTSLVGLVTAFGLGVPILACPVGAVLGHVALRRIAEKGTQGRGMALAGVIIGWFGTALLILGTALIIALIAAGWE